MGEKSNNISFESIAICCAVSWISYISGTSMYSAGTSTYSTARLEAKFDFFSDMPNLKKEKHS